MKKNYAEYFESIGLTVEGNRAYGIVRAYETNVLYNIMDSENPLLIHISCYADNAQKSEIIGGIKAAKIKFCNPVLTDFGVLIGLNSYTTSGMLKRLPEYMDLFFGTLERAGARGAACCPVCGQELNAENSVQCDGVEGVAKVTVDSGCFENINAQIRAENNLFEVMPNNYLRGFLGALLGALLGAVTAIIFYMLGFVSSVSSLIGIVVGSLLFCKFGGKRDKIMILIVCLTTLVCMMLTVPAIYTVATAIALEQEEVDMGAVEGFLYLLREDAEIREMFIDDMVAMLIFTVVGAVYEIFALRRSIQRRKELK